MDQNYGSLSSLGKKCFTLSKKELDNFSAIKEIDIPKAKKLGSYSEELLSQLEVYTSEKSSFEEKVKALEAVKSAYGKMVPFVKKHIACFEPRSVLIMCENKMILAGVMPSNIAEKLKEVEYTEE